MAARIEYFHDLDAVAARAGDSLGRAAQPSLYSRLSWFRLLQAHCPPPGSLLALRAPGDGADDTWLFLSVRRREAQAFAAWYSLRFDAIGNRASDAMKALAAAIRDGGIARVELAPIEDPEPLASGFRAAGWVVELQPATTNWRAFTGGIDFATFWAGRPGRLRSTFKRRAKGASLDIRIHDRFDAEAWAAYEQVYRSSWKPEEGSFPFLRELAAQEGDAGTLRLGIARDSDGKPIAAQLWLVENGEATIHKLAYAESAKALSPGTILSEAMFRHAIDRDRVRVIDYGTGDEPYKADWMDEKRLLWRLVAHDPRRLKGLAGLVRARASRLVRRLRSR